MEVRQQIYDMLGDGKCYEKKEREIRRKEIGGSGLFYTVRSGKASLNRWH